MTRNRVLVLGEDSRSCLSVVRSLGRQKIEVWLGTMGGDSIVPYSRYVSHTLRLPSTKAQRDIWLLELQKLISSTDFDLIVPCSDSTLVPIVQERNALEPLARFAIPSEAAFEYSYYKNKTLELARDLGVPAPLTTFAESESDLAADQSLRQRRFPLVVKPVASKIWKGGKRFDLSVKLAYDWPGLLETTGRLLSVAPVLIQDHFEGTGVGQEFLVDNGVIVQAFQHERVHEPLKGGGSTYRKSAPLDPSMLRHSERLLSRLRWTGVAMVEYKRNPVTGEFALMEINGRFWGSLPLAIAAGADFPYLLYLLALNKPLPDRSAYKVGVFGRNVRKDLGWFKERIENGAETRGRSIRLAGELLHGLRNIISGKERWDEITHDDPAPGLIQIRNDARLLAEKTGGLIRRRARRLLASLTVWQNMQRVSLRRLLSNKTELLFVCKGNICRSPFAEAYTKLAFDRSRITGISAVSAGTYQEEGREPPDSAKLVAREFGVIIDHHRSRTIKESIIASAGAIACMDFRDYLQLRRDFPSARAKLLFLGPFDSRSPRLEIPDPWDRPPEEFRASYTQIRSAVDGLIEAIAGRRRMGSKERRDRLAHSIPSSSGPYGEVSSIHNRTRQRSSGTPS